MLDTYSKQKIREILKEKKPAVVVTHVNPDGDAIGASLALAQFLKKFGLPVQLVIPNEVPEFLKWLPNFDLVHTFNNEAKYCKDLIKNSATLFIVDFNDIGRVGKMKKTILSAKAFKIMIDHHQNPGDICEITISETFRSSAGEMIYVLMNELGELDKLDKDIATSLYVAIMTDTGNFRYASSHSEIFNIAGALVDKKIDKDKIYSLIYDSYSEDRMKLMGYCMSEKLVVLHKYCAAYISITREELNRYNHQIGDTEGFVNIPFSIKGIKVTALLVENKDYVKISFRSKGSFSVDDFASKYFNGGGHVNAAGGEANISLKEAIALFESKISECKDEHV
jgi:phosphoesterase RecJ-like protein